MLRQFFCLLFFFLCIASIRAQEEPQVLLEWSAIIPFQKSVDFAVTQTDVLAISDNGLIQINKENLDLTFISKVEGLSSSNPIQIAYNDNTQIGLIAYMDANLDIISDGRFINAPFIKESNAITGSKNINDLAAFKNNIYILTDFGIVIFNTSKLEVTTTLRTALPVTNFTMVHDYYYFSLGSTLYRQRNDVSDLQFAFIEEWEKMDQGVTILDLASRGDNLLMSCANGNLYELDQDLDSILIYSSDTHIMEDMYVDDRQIVYGVEKCIDEESCKIKISVLKTDGSTSELAPGCIDRPLSVITDNQGRIWCADEFNNIRWIEETSNECNRIASNTPWISNVFDVEREPNGDLWIATGSYDISFPQSFFFVQTSFLNRKDGEWSFVSWEFDSLMKANFLAVITDIERDPTTGKVYLASYLDGILEIDGERRRVYNDKDGHLGFDTGDPIRTKVFDMEISEEGDLWLSNYRASEPIRVKRSDGRWEKYSALGRTELTHLVIDDFDNKWYIDISNGNGLVVFNENTIADPTDDQIRRIGSANSQLTTDNTTIIAKDLDGAIWVGTDRGVFIFDCASQVFEADVCRGFQATLIVDGIPENLLNDDRVTAIGVDGANRKWIGTQNGLFVTSPSANELIYEFKADNSPLLSDAITSLNIDQETGTVYIGTQEGLSVVKTDAIAGGRIHKDEIKVYPNPVEPNYTGPIAFEGFARDSDLRITDVSGRLVLKATANGGQFTWDGNDVYGRRVATGIYYIWGATKSETDPQGVIGKVLVISAE